MFTPPLLNNRYQLEELQGSGGMATVYRARDLMLERMVAVKILRQDFSTDAEFRERFRLEAKSAANLSHANIVTVHDFGLDANQLFIVMEYVPGTDLKTILQQRGRLPVEEAVSLLIQACAGLGYAHRAGLVHCDVKPQNMLVTPDLRLKVTDFGIARALSTIHPDEKQDIVWGSPQYLSPEQASGSAPSPASDVYALGVVLYEMLVGQLPFPAGSVEELIHQHQYATPPAPRSLNPGIPEMLEQVILKVLSKEPANRYRTADQLGRVLAGFMESIRPPIRLDSQPVITGSTAPQSGSGATPPRPTPYPRPAGVPPVYKSVLPPQPAHQSNSLDWTTWLLALLALIAVGGLIPFWLWVYYFVNPPIP
jgi:serine/threonine-protein kinase